MVSSIVSGVENFVSGKIMKQKSMCFLIINIYQKIKKLVGQEIPKMYLQVQNSKLSAAASPGIQQTASGLS